MARPEGVLGRALGARGGCPHAGASIGGGDTISRVQGVVGVALPGPEVRWGSSSMAQGQRGVPPAPAGSSPAGCLVRQEPSQSLGQALGEPVGEGAPGSLPASS